MIKSVLMSESNIQKFAKMLQVMRGMEADIGIGSLSKSDKAVFTSIADLISLSSEEVDVKAIALHPDLINMPIPTLYKCLRDLQKNGLLERVGHKRSGLYKLAWAEAKNLF